MDNWGNEKVMELFWTGAQLVEDVSLLVEKAELEERGFAWDEESGTWTNGGDRYFAPSA